MSEDLVEIIGRVIGFCLRVLAVSIAVAFAVKLVFGGPSTESGTQPVPAVECARPTKEGEE